jgi:hypothetical protein
MAPPNTRARANWAVERATSLPEVWALVAKHRGVLGARRLMRVCKAARAGGLEYLRTLPGLVMCGGASLGVGRVNDAWKLDLATMRWEPMPALLTARSNHACCAVRGALVVLSGFTEEEEEEEEEGEEEEEEEEEDVLTSSVEMFSSSEEGGAFAGLPPLSRGGIWGAAAIAVDESGSAAGQLLLLGVYADEDDNLVSTVQLVDLATGACAPQNNLLHPRAFPAAGRLPDGRVVCAGGIDGDQSAEVWGSPEQGEPDAAWSWSELPRMSVERVACCGSVLSDGRFAVLGGWSNGVSASSCEALVVDGDAHWVSLSPMHDARANFACGAVAGCVIVAGGVDRKSAEVYDEELNRWLRLPFDLPYESWLASMGSAVL